MTKSQLCVKQIYLPGDFKRYKQQNKPLRNCYEYSKNTTAIRFNLLHVCPSLPSFAFAVIRFGRLLPSVTQFGGSTHCLNFYEFRDSLKGN